VYKKKNQKKELAMNNSINLTKEAIVYIRASLKEDKQANTPQAQLDACERWAHQNGFRIKSVIEERISGTVDPLQRAGFKRVLDMVATGDIVLIQCRDRLARKAWMSGRVSEYIVDLGCDVVSVDEGWYQGNEILSSVKDAVAQEERNKISLRTRRALRVLKDQGKRYGEVPFGMMVDENNNLNDNKSEMEMLEAVIEMRRSGMKFKDIIVECKRLDIRTRKGDVPSQQTLSRWCEGVKPLLVSPSEKRKAKRTLGEVAPLLKSSVLMLRSSGLSYRKIAAALNEMGAVNSAGGEIVHTQVARIVKRAQSESE
jgi:DNA invertase Pin-like site-specific DNA recombinase